MLPRILSKHGRERFIERIGYMGDRDMISFASLPNSRFRFVWKDTRKKKRLVRKLITVLRR